MLVAYEWIHVFLLYYSLCSVCGVKECLNKEKEKCLVIRELIQNFKEFFFVWWKLMEVTVNNEMMVGL